MSRPLFELTQDIVELDRKMEEAGEQGVDEAIMEYLQANEAEQEAKLEGYGWYIRSLQAEAASAKSVEQEFADKRRAAENKIQSLKDRLHYHMTETEQPRIHTQSFKFRLQVNSATPVVIDEQKLPPEYWTAPAPVPDKMKIREALDSGVEVPGANYGERGTHVRIA